MAGHHILAYTSGLNDKNQYTRFLQNFQTPSQESEPEQILEENLDRGRVRYEEGKSKAKRISTATLGRRLTAAFLPFVVMIMFIATDMNNQPIAMFMSNTPFIFRLICGALSGIIIIMIANELSTEETVRCIAILVLSFLGAFLMYTFMIKLFEEMAPFLLGLILFGGLYYILVGRQKLSEVIQVLFDKT